MVDVPLTRLTEEEPAERGIGQWSTLHSAAPLEVTPLRRQARSGQFVVRSVPAGVEGIGQWSTLPTPGLGDSPGRVIYPGRFAPLRAIAEHKLHDLPSGAPRRLVVRSGDWSFLEFGDWPRRFASVLPTIGREVGRFVLLMLAICQINAAISRKRGAGRCDAGPAFSGGRTDLDLTFFSSSRLVGIFCWLV